MLDLCIISISLTFRGAKPQAFQFVIFMRRVIKPSFGLMGKQFKLMRSAKMQHF
jgi:hypothetical protein